MVMHDLGHEVPKTILSFNRIRNIYFILADLVYIRLTCDKNICINRIMVYYCFICNTKDSLQYPQVNFYFRLSSVCSNGFVIITISII